LIKETDMRVLLWEDIEKLGKRGEVVEVADGYARNYLLPQRLATPATNHHVKQLEAARRRAEKLREQQRQALLKKAEQLETAVCTVEVSANEEGILFGSVGPSHIATALKEEGLAVDEKSIILEKPIKELGVYAVKVKLQEDISAQVRVWVVEGGPGGS
jgi:large subunit ribosomal protein L9